MQWKILEAFAFITSFSGFLKVTFIFTRISFAALQPNWMVLSMNPDQSVAVSTPEKWIHLTGFWIAWRKLVVTPCSGSYATRASSKRLKPTSFHHETIHIQGFIWSNTRVYCSHKKLWLHLTSGTPTLHAVSILILHSKIVTKCAVLMGSWAENRKQSYKLLFLKHLAIFLNMLLGLDICLYIFC